MYSQLAELQVVIEGKKIAPLIDRQFEQPIMAVGGLRRRPRTSVEKRLLFRLWKLLRGADAAGRLVPCVLFTSSVLLAYF